MKVPNLLNDRLNGDMGNYFRKTKEIAIKKASDNKLIFFSS